MKKHLPYIKYLLIRKEIHRSIIQNWSHIFESRPDIALITARGYMVTKYLMICVMLFVIFLTML